MASIDDRWHRPVRDEQGRRTGGLERTERYGQGARWRARYYDPDGRQHSRVFARKTDAREWLDGVTSSLVTGTYTDPKTARMTVAEWCDLWLAGYATRRPSTVRQAQVHLRVIRAAFAGKRLADVRPSHVKAWTVELQERYAPSTTYAIYRRFAQVMGDAAHDGIIPRSPCSRKTSPGQPTGRPYVATTEQVWAIYDAMGERSRVAVLLAAFAGLRISEAAALRVADVDFLRGTLTPSGETKTKGSKSAIPIPRELVDLLAAEVARHKGETVVADELGRPVTAAWIGRDYRAARQAVEDLPEGFRFHDLRHYFASLLIASGLDVKVVQARLRHASAKTTLDTYGHLWPDTDETSRAAVAVAMATREVPARSNACHAERNSRPGR